MSPGMNLSDAASPNTDLLSAKSMQADVQIIDIRKTKFSNTEENLQSLIVHSLSTKNVAYEDPRFRNSEKSQTSLLRSIPTLVLYDDRGLEVFDQITYIPEYYLTNAEIDVFENHADQMVSQYVKDNSVLVELGVGSMRKTKYFLDAIVRQNKSVTYYALDLSEKTLKECLDSMAAAYPPSENSKISFVGLFGTYEDSLQYVRDNIDSKIPKMFMWLGSSIGNLNREDAASFLKAVGETALSIGDTFLCGIDKRNNSAEIAVAYNDPHGLTEEFILNGLDHVCRIFNTNEKVIDRANFEYISIYNEVEGRHEAYYKSKLDQTLQFPLTNDKTATINLLKDELINVEYSYKYSADEVDRLVQDSQLYAITKFTDTRELYDLHLFQKPPFFFKTSLNQDHSLVPDVAEFKELWKAWDTISISMISAEKSNEKIFLEQPITLRHPFLFYLGHLPSFMDIQLTRCIGETYTEPKYFTTIFERGIDPDFEDPDQCHPHSEVPNRWPSVEEVLAYRDRVRERALSIFEVYQKTKDKRLGRVIHMCFEHDVMHIETFLYMLVQWDAVKPPKGVSPPPTYANKKINQLLPAKLKTIASRIVTTGINDPESDDFTDKPPPAMFGWDNEKPVRKLPVDEFQIQSRPVTIGEYYMFLQSKNFEAELIPSSWGTMKPLVQAEVEKSFGVKTVFELFPIKHAWNWPVFVSNDQASAYAVIHGLRLPTEGELLALHDDWKQSGNTAVANYGFKSWLPQDVTEESFFSGGWEWTSTVMNEHEGFEKSELYPGYSSDFFDTKHNIVLGGSYATIPRIAERRSFRNWYQRKYPFVFATFRCVKA
ncbi:hypothetical protein HK098_007356 [Nowakowskiella sp. JEL0407]|nr:hypothetical protein HK098_007356 [Nowakowskiella sp. JEL0407]